MISSRDQHQGSNMDHVSSAFVTEPKLNSSRSQAKSMPKGPNMSPKKVLREVLENHRPEIVSQLNCNTMLLTYLAKYNLIEHADILKYENVTGRAQRNSRLLEGMLEREVTVPDAYSKFMEALKRSDQEHMVAIITNVDKEIKIVDQYQDVLNKHLDEIHDYLKKESRRTEVRFSTVSPDKRHQGTTKPVPDNLDREALTEFLYKVHQSTKATLTQFERCKEVIEKLHNDCDQVAQKNADMLSKLRECEQLVTTMVSLEGIIPAGKGVHDHDDACSTISLSTRTKREEADTLMSSIKQNMGLLAEQFQTKTEEHKHCKQAIDNIIVDLEERLLAVSRHSESPPRDISNRTNKYLQNTDAPSLGLTTMMVQGKTLRPTVDELADRMSLYVHHESHMTHKMNLTKIQSGPSHRNFDQVDKELVHLQKELRKNDKDTSLALVTHVVDVTKAEREDCIQLVDEISKTVHARRLKLQEQASTHRGHKRKSPPKNARKVKLNHSLESNFSKKLVEVLSEAKQYIELEQDQAQKHRSELLQKKVEFDTQLKDRTRQIKDLEKRVCDVQNEKDKYRKLYEQEKIVNSTKMLTKPVIPKRERETASFNRGSSLNARGHSKRFGSNFPERKPLGRPKPKLTARASLHLTGLRDTMRVKKKARVRPMHILQEEENKLRKTDEDIQASRSLQHKVENSVADPV